MATQLAATSAHHDDRRLTGRTYSIPFEDVWQGALRIIRERMRNWSLDIVDDHDGIITVDVRGFHKKLNGTFRVDVALDSNGQTRVDARAATPDIFHDFGVNARRVDSFFRQLDREAERERQRRLTTGRV